MTAIRSIARAALALALVACSGPREPEVVPPPHVRALFEPSDDALAEVAFLAGTWLREEDDLWHVESWTPPRGGRMVGHAHLVRGSESAFTEALQIRLLARRVVYVATPEDEETTLFGLTEARAGYARFEAPENEFPRVIEYELVEPDLLEVRLTGAGAAPSHAHDGEHAEPAERRVAWRMRR